MTVGWIYEVTITFNIYIYNRVKIKINVFRKPSTCIYNMCIVPWFQDHIC